MLNFFLEQHMMGNQMVVHSSGGNVVHGGMSQGNMISHYSSNFQSSQQHQLSQQQQQLGPGINPQMPGQQQQHIRNQHIIVSFYFIL